MLIEVKMSLRYRLLGIPTNIDEVVERAKRTGEIPEIYSTRQNIGTLVPNCQRFKYRIGVKIGRVKVRAYEWVRSFTNFVQEVDSGRADFVIADKVSFMEVQGLARELSQKGVQVLCGNEIFCSAEE